MREETKKMKRLIIFEKKKFLYKIYNKNVFFLLQANFLKQQLVIFSFFNGDMTLFPVFIKSIQTYKNQFIIIEVSVNADLQHLLLSCKLG